MNAAKHGLNSRRLLLAAALHVLMFRLTLLDFSRVAGYLIDITTLKPATPRLLTELFVKRRLHYPKPTGKEGAQYMDEALQKVLADVQAKIQGHLDAVAKLKKTANSLVDMAGESPIYPDADEESNAGVGPGRSDAYYGKPLATACREYLEFRRRAVSGEEILRGLEQGGFDFDALGWAESSRLRALVISMAKNTQVFHRLPSNTWGLLAWYPTASQKKKTKSKGKGETDNEEITDEEIEEKGSAADTTEPKLLTE
jgi:hypothetical protein